MRWKNLLHHSSLPLCFGLQSQRISPNDALSPPIATIWKSSVSRHYKISMLVTISLSASADLAHHYPRDVLWAHPSHQDECREPVEGPGSAIIKGRRWMDKRWRDGKSPKAQQQPGLPIKILQATLSRGPCGHHHPWHAPVKWGKSYRHVMVAKNVMSNVRRDAIFQNDLAADVSNDITSHAFCIFLETVGGASG